MAAITGRGHSATAVTEACSWSTAVRADLARAAIDKGAPSLEVMGPPRPAMATRSRPTLKWGPLAAITTARISGSEPMAAMATGRSDQKAGPRALRFSGRSSHRVATWPSASMVSTSETKEAMVWPEGGLMGERVGVARPGRRKGRVTWNPRLVTRGSLPERLFTLSTFTPETAAALPGPPWLRHRRTAAAEAFASAPLPTEKDEVWRYSRRTQQHPPAN